MKCSITILLCTMCTGLLSFVHAATNVILLVADDGGYAEFGFQQPFVSSTIEFKTPHLDDLAAQSVVFSQGYVSGTVCSPSRAGLLSGRYQQRFGYEYNISNDNVFADGMPPWIPILPEQFKLAGHVTGCIGKWHIGSQTDKQPQNRGVDFFYGLWGGSRPYFRDNSQETDRQKRLKRNTTNIDWWTESSFNGIVPDSAGKGRHLTDAFGDEMAQFVADNAQAPNGFFLYVPFTSPHGPYDKAKQQDMDVFNATSFNTQQKKAAALIYALDRAVGFMSARLKDPNDDGDDSDSIFDDTAIAFYVDNGGATGNTYNHDNTPLRGSKSTTWEGGIRVPFFIKLPGVAPTIYRHPVTSLDATATLLAAAGAPFLPAQDGIDLYPYLSGSNTNAPHEFLYWRQGEKWAVRKGDWKLCKGNAAADIALYQLNANGTGENTDRIPSFPEIYNELEAAFTTWDLRNTKPFWSRSNPPQNTEDRFQFRPQDNLPNWSANNVWSKPDDSWGRTSLSPEDAYANGILQFPVRDDLSYTSNNNMTRQTDLTFALNEIRLVGTANGAANQTASIIGNPLLLTRNLTNALPRIHNQSTVNGGMAFSFMLNNNLLLRDELQLTGDGQGSCHIQGNISSETAGLNKSGNATVTLSGTNHLGGAVTLSAGALTLAGGVLEIPTLTIGSNATLKFDISTAGVTHLLVDEQATLDGELAISLANEFAPSAGDRFTLLHADSIIGTFSATNNPPLAANLSWVVDYTPTEIELRVASPGDRDGDRLMDSWEQTHFGDLITSNGGTRDSDQDHFLDEHEFLAGTNPTNPASFLHISQIESLGGNEVEVRWASTSGKVYSLLYTTNLLDNTAWQPYQGSLFSTGKTHRIRTPLPPNFRGRLRIGLE